MFGYRWERDEHQPLLIASPDRNDDKVDFANHIQNHEDMLYDVGMLAHATPSESSGKHINIFGNGTKPAEIIFPHSGIYTGGQEGFVFIPSVIADTVDSPDNKSNPSSLVIHTEQHDHDQDFDDNLHQPDNMISPTSSTESPNRPNHHKFVHDFPHYPTPPPNKRTASSSFKKPMNDVFWYTMAGKKNSLSIFFHCANRI